MNIGNITSNNFNLDDNGKDMQIEVYEQLIEQLQQKIDKVLEDIKEYKEMGYSKYYENEIEIELIDKILQILDGGEKDK